MDGLAIRPAMLQLGERLAMHGYFVLLPDLLCRAGPYEPMDPSADAHGRADAQRKSAVNPAKTLNPGAGSK